MLIPSSTRPWLLGPLAIYAPNLHVARQAYETVTSGECRQAFGTVVVDNQYEVDWVNLAFGVVPRNAD